MAPCRCFICQEAGRNYKDVILPQGCRATAKRQFTMSYAARLSLVSSSPPSSSLQRSDSDLLPQRRLIQASAPRRQLCQTTSATCPDKARPTSRCTANIDGIDASQRGITKRAARQLVDQT
jgi:hypothetical protein